MPWLRCLLFSLALVFPHAFTLAGVNCSDFLNKPIFEREVKSGRIDPTAISMSLGLMGTGGKSVIEGVAFDVIAVSSSRGLSVSLTTRTHVDAILMNQIKFEIETRIIRAYHIFSIGRADSVPELRVFVLQGPNSPYPRIDPSRELKIKVFAETRETPADIALPREEYSVITIQLSRHHEVSAPFAIFLGAEI